MNAVVKKLIAVTLACLIPSLKILSFIIALQLSGNILAQESEGRFRVPPHIDQLLWNQSTSGFLANSASASITNLSITILILTAGRLTRQISSGYLSSFSTLVLSQGVMRGIDSVRDYYTASSDGDFLTRSSLSNADLVPFSQYLPKRLQFLISLVYALKDSFTRLLPGKQPSHSWIYFHDYELNDYVALVWIPPELADRYDNTTPGQGYFRVIPRKSDSSCEWALEPDPSLKNVIRRLSCTTTDESFFIHLYPRRLHGENRLFIRPFKEGAAGELFLSPYLYGDGLTSTFITAPLSQNFQNYSDRYFNSTQNRFAETSDQCLNREHCHNANPLHQSTFLLMAELTAFSQQHWQPRFSLFQTLKQELDYVETLETVASQINPQLEFFSLESEHLTLVSTGNQGYLSIDRHKNHRYQTIMSLETSMDLSQVRTTDLEHLQQQRDALWSEHWQLMFNLFAMVASQLLTEQVLSTQPVKYIIEADVDLEPDRKQVNLDDLILQAGKSEDTTTNSGGADSSGKASGLSGDAPYQNTRHSKRKRKGLQDDDPGPGDGSTPPPARQPAPSLSTSSAEEDLTVLVPVKTRKLDDGTLEITEYGNKELSHSRKDAVEALRQTRTAKQMVRKEEKKLKKMTDEDYMFYSLGWSHHSESVSGSSSDDSSTFSGSSTPEPESRPENPGTRTRKVHFQFSDSESLPEPETGTEPKLPTLKPFLLATHLRENSGETSDSVGSTTEKPASPTPEQNTQLTSEVVDLQAPSPEQVPLPEKLYCPLEGCSTAQGKHKTFPTAKKLRSHINSHITEKYFQSVRTDISIGNRVAVEQKNIACRIGGCNEICKSTAVLGKHLKKDHPNTMDHQPFNAVFAARYDEVKAATPAPGRGRGRPKKVVAAAVELKGQAAFTKLLAEAKNHGIKFFGYHSSDPLSKMTDSGAGKNYVTRFGDHWFCTDCDSGMLYTPEITGKHFQEVHMNGPQYWCPAAKNTHEGGVRPSFTSEQEYYQHLRSHKPEGMTDEQASANGWIPMSDFNPFTPFVLPPPLAPEQ